MRLFTLLLVGLPAFCAYRAEVIRDEYGVPHIYGKRDADVVFALAFSMAEDNFWQLEEDYIRNLGRAAEVHGRAGLEGDIHFRLFEVEKRARLLYASTPSSMRAVADAFAAGYNYYLKKHPQVKPRLVTRMQGWEVIAFQDSSPALAGSGVTRDDVIREFPILAAVQYRTPSNDDEGSNMWAILPKKSASGAPLMFLNPHVGFFGGGQRYEAHLESKQGLSLSGFAILGTPYIRSGFGANHGWCHTNNNADIVDVWKETFDDDSEPLAYRYGNDHRKATAWSVEIPMLIDGRRELVKMNLRKTHHGPIVGMRQGNSLSKRGPDTDPLRLMQQRIAMGKSRTLDEFKQVMAQRAMTGSNTIYADTKGNIYYVHGNAIPKRNPAFDWTKPVEGADAETEWQGSHAFSDLVQFTNPDSGFLQNCNSTPLLAAGEPSTDIAYPKYFLPEQDNFRSKRSREILTGSEKFTFEEWSRAAFDTRIYLAKSEVAQLASEWEMSTEKKGALSELIAELKSWDGVSTAQSVPMSLFMASYFARDDRESPTGFLNLSNLEKAKAELERDFGTWRIPWGELNRLQRIHTSGTLESFSDAKPSLPVPGAPGQVGVIFNFYASTPNGQKKSYGRSGNTYIAVVEFGQKIRAGSQLVFGQSADPQSPHYLDQAELYSKQQFKPVHYYRSDVRRHSKSTVRLKSD